jgi:hypothetical protein
MSEVVSSEQPAAAKPYRVLSLDGGGMRGIYTAAFLDRLVVQFARTRGELPIMLALTPSAKMTRHRLRFELGDNDAAYSIMARSSNLVDSYQVGS